MNSETFDVMEFGALSDGKALNTAAIQRAVDACAAAGGGQVLVPAGIFLSGALQLRSHVDFHLHPGATLNRGAPRKQIPISNQNDISTFFPAPGPDLCRSGCAWIVCHRSSDGTKV